MLRFHDQERFLASGKRAPPARGARGRSRGSAGRGAEGARSSAGNCCHAAAWRACRIGSQRSRNGVYGNADEGGFFRPQHEEENLRALAASRGSLGAVERMGLVGHQWAIVRAGRAGVDSVLDLALAFCDDPDADVLLALRAPLAGCVGSARRTGGEAVEAALCNAIAAACRGSLEALGLDARSREPDDTRLRRAALLVLMGDVARDPATVAAATERATRYLADRGAVEPNLTDSVVNLAASEGDARLWERLRKEARRGTPQEQRRFLLALGCFREPALVDRTLALTGTDAVGTQDVAMLLMRLLANPAATEATWAFMKKHWKTLRRRLPPMLVTRPIEGLVALATPAWRRDVAAFFRANPVPTGARAVRQTLEQMDLTAAFDARAAAALARRA